MKTSVGLWIALLGSGACHPAPPPPAVAQDYAGRYVLQTVDSQPLPYIRPGVVAGEGTALVSVMIQLAPPDTYRAQVVAAFTDSGTVTDTLTASGTWSRRGGYLVLASQWAPWRLSSRVRSDTLMGWLEAGGFTLPHFSIFTSRFFGHDAELRFTRQP
ncbi:MAG TPA: hypothetical protein VGP80_17150 [Gemmatimonadales bacterium]|nr:hypothetical protein [Gemmatimonadales bacterium]